MNASPPTGDTIMAQSAHNAASRPRSSGLMSVHSHTASISRYSEAEETKTAVKVAVRVRPPLPPNDPALELIPNRFRGVTCDVPNSTTLSVNSGAQGKKLFIFDRVFPDTESQDGLWNYVSDSVKSFVQGYNVSILAYGQSGAGKSYTMGTSRPEEQDNPKTLGIIPRAAATLFEMLGEGPTKPVNGSNIRPPSKYGNVAQPKTLDSNRTWQLKASYVEIYNEQLRDLLVPESVPANERSAVAIREDTKGRIILTGAQQININSVEDLSNALNFGSSIRQTDATAINSKSSRSHAVFSLNLIQRKPRGGQRESTNGQDGWVTFDSKLHFVDLAGSERLKNSGLTGERVKEGISINAGLASLGKVISQLSSRSGVSHVSYRDSRLTRLLQDSLGGNAITYMIACVNPVEFHLSETLNTVQYAQRARNIQSRPQIQQRAEDGDKQVIIDRLRSEVAFLRDQIRLSERAERKNGHVSRSKREVDRENELQNQLLDIQENYSALSSRHAKLIADVAQAKGGDADSMPALKEAIGNNATSLDRLNRSNNFAEAVEQVVLEYEKTIQSLESSLSNSRASLSTSESSLLEREAKIVYLEAVAQQLQARIQKAMDREANNESYLRDLEAKLEALSSGEEKYHVVISDLRKELTRMRESESSAEEYISTLEERLAEAEQDTDVMQREIKRLEQVVERQRIVGKMDGFKNEFDSYAQEKSTSKNGVSTNAPQAPPSVSDDMFHDRLVATTTNVEHSNGEMTAEGAEAEWKTFGPMEGDDDSASERSISDYGEAAPIPPKSAARMSRWVHNRAETNDAQIKALADKLETVTMELFDLRVDHENASMELDDVSRKYEIALSTLAELQDAVDEARTTRPTSYLGARPPAELKDDMPRSSAARVVASDMSSSTQSPTLVDESEGGLDIDQPASVPKEESLADAIRRLRRVNAEKDINMAELTESYSQLQDQHKDTLNYIEELKEEMSKMQTSPTISSQRSSGNMRRSVMGPLSASRDRESRVFDALRTLTNSSFENHPEAKLNFEKSLNAAATESQLRIERTQTLEAELAAVRKEMDVKNTMISGLTRERAARNTNNNNVDMSLINTLRGHLAESQRKLADLHEANAAHQEKLNSQMSALRSYIPETNAPDEEPEPDKSNQDIHRELSKWETAHKATQDSIRASEQQLMETIVGLEATLQTAEAGPNDKASARDSAMQSDKAVDFEAEKAKHFAQVQSLQKEIDGYKSTAETHAAKLQALENSYSQIVKEVEEEAKSKQLTESELKTHRDLVMNLEHQIEQQKSLATFHQQGLASLEDSHAKELEDLKKTLDAERAENDRKLNDQIAQHQAMTTELKEELSKAQVEMTQLMSSVASALNEEHDTGALHKRIKSITDERGIVTKPAASLNPVDEDQMSSARQLSMDLEAKIKELTALNEETVQQLERSVAKEKRSSKMVQDLETKLNSSEDKHEEFSNRLSIVQKDKTDIEKELEVHKSRVAQLESQLTELKRMTQHSVRSYGADESGDVSRNPSIGGGLRKTNSHQSLPASPPPSVPLPPLPIKDGAASPPASRHTSRDMAGPGSFTQQQLEESEARLRTLEKHLAAEKQLTSTLEEALVDLETQTNRTKADVEGWKRKCRELEEEANHLRKERGTMRNSLQAVEEERDRRIRAEQARRQLEERMEALGNKTKQQKKKGGAGLNCF